MFSPAKLSWFTVIQLYIARSVASSVDSEFKEGIDINSIHYNPQETFPSIPSLILRSWIWLLRSFIRYRIAFLI